MVKGCGHLMGMRRNTKVLDGAGYEVFVAKWLREQGFRQILHTGATGDFGVDLVAKKHGIYYAVQCKYYSSSVSGAAVQEAVAGMAYYHCDRAMVVTNSQLTRGARALAEANHVLVLEHVEPGKVTAAGIATPERIISVAVCTVLSVLLLPKIRTASATGWGVVCPRHYPMLSDSQMYSGASGVVLEPGAGPDRASESPLTKQFCQGACEMCCS